MVTHPTASTADPAYAQRLRRLSSRGGRLRGVLDPQRPYRWNLRRMRPGFVLDVGCGIGRNLHHLGGTGVGVDHNPDCVETCRESGLTAFTTDQFALSEHAVGEHFDSLLLAHVVEHMTAEEAAGLVRRYLPFVRPDARTIIITPQQRGQRSDQTHVTYFDPEAIRVLAVQAGLEVESIRSFPFPRLVGRWFTHNETVSVLRRVSPR